MRAHIVILLITISGCAQKSLPHFDYVDDKQERIASKCALRNSYSPAVRRANFPFNKATNVKLVSFETYPDSNAFEFRLPEKNGRVDLAALSEQVDLTTAGIDSLTYLLYSVGYAGEPQTNEGSGCYNPRNAILFMDSIGQVSDFIEICFECMGNRLSSPNISVGEICSEKYVLLINFFLRRGIEIGTNGRTRRDLKIVPLFIMRLRNFLSLLRLLVCQ